MIEFEKDPVKIEKKSFEIITKELGDIKFEESHGKVIKRVIHTTADFEYASIIKISEGAIDNAIESLKKGSYIYTDTKMASEGINKRILSKFGGKVLCYVSDDDVIEESRSKGVTRSMAAMEKAILNDKIKIFVNGNAPTALFTLIDAINSKKLFPDLIVGVPVGFVGAAESKEALIKTKVPYITTLGRKGGSTVGAAIINALLYMIE